MNTKQRDLVRALLAKGLGPLEIARRTKRSRQAVWMMIRRHNMLGNATTKQYYFQKRGK